MQALVAARSWAAALVWFSRFLFAWPDKLKIALHVEAVAARDLVLRQRLLGDLMVLGVNFLVSAAPRITWLRDPP
jgi:hypothetical protein